MFVSKIAQHVSSYNLCSVNYNIEWIVLQLEAIRAKQVHKAPPTFPHQQHHFQVLVT